MNRLSTVMVVVVAVGSQSAPAAPIAAEANEGLGQAVVAALGRPWLPADKPLAEVRAFIDRRIARLPQFETREQWDRYSTQLRKQILAEIVFRGEADAWRKAPAQVEWLDTIEGLPGYRIRKLRYEALPGLWIPALLYEPLQLQQRVPVVLNVNGHDPEGKRARDEQLRSINCAKRGMLALHPEWLGMGQLRSPGFVHGRMNQLDLCGTSGLSVFYLGLSRALDVLCQLPHADRQRVAVTGLSGGGWQTAWISALDDRVTLANAVAGYTSLRIAITHNDMGDSEQAPSDFGAIADGLHLTALRAPRPTLLTYNSADDCCFKADHTLEPLLAAARPIYELLQAPNRLYQHVNIVPGTHNYERDNREAFYRVIADEFFAADAAMPRHDLPSEAELQTAAALEVPMPAENLDFSRLAQRLAAGLPVRPVAAAADADAQSHERRRARLTDLLKIPRYQVRVQRQSEQQHGPATIRTWRAAVGEGWTVPIVEIDPEQKSSHPPLIVVDDGGFGDAGASDSIRRAVEDGRHVFAVDPLFVGQSRVTGADPQVYFAVAVASVGERPLGLQAAQLAAVARWVQSKSSRPCELVATGPRTTTMALVAAAVEPTAIRGLRRNRQLTSLKQLVDEDRTIEEFPELFPFGLLAEFDLADVQELTAADD